MAQASELNDTTQLATVCGEAPISEDGRYALLNECPTAASGATEGKVTRYTFETGEKTVIATYGKNDSLFEIAVRGDAFVFAIAHDFQASNVLVADSTLSTWDVRVGRWDAASPARIIATGAGPALRTAPHQLGVTGSASHVWFYEGTSTEDHPLDPPFVVVPMAAGTAPLRVDSSVSELSNGHGVTTPLISPDDARLLFITSRRQPDGSYPEAFSTVELTNAPTLGPKVPVVWTGPKHSTYGADYLGYDGHGILAPAVLDGMFGFVDFDTSAGTGTFLTTGHPEKTPEGRNLVGTRRVFKNGDIDFVAGEGNDRVYMRMARRVGATPVAYARSHSTTSSVIVDKAEEHVLTFQSNWEAGPTGAESVDQTLSVNRLTDGTPLVNPAPIDDGGKLAGDANDLHDLYETRDFATLYMDGHFDWFDVKTAQPRGRYYGDIYDFKWFSPNSEGTFAVTAQICGESPLENRYTLLRVSPDGQARTAVPCVKEFAGGVFAVSVPNRPEVLVYVGGTTWRSWPRPNGRGEYELRLLK